MSRQNAPDPAQFIARHLPLVQVPSLPDIRLHLAASGSGLNRLQAGTPYWAYVWAGGLALASHVAAHPDTVEGRRVLDLGPGSGLVGIAAAKAGAATVLAVDTDPNAIAAVALNAQANDVTLHALCADLTQSQLPDVDLILAGDVFYAPSLARRMCTWLDRCVDAGIDCLIGDPGRAPLPLSRLRPLSRYDVSDFGSGAKNVTSTVFAYEKQDRSNRAANAAQARRSTRR